MKRLVIIKVLLIISFFNSDHVLSKINNKIIANVGNQIITDLDIEDEIKTMLILNQKKFSQENINQVKNMAVNALIKRSIKKNEILKYKIKDYDEKGLSNYLIQVSKQLNTDREGLKNILETNLINYEIFIDKYKTELRWNNLIYSLYKNQLNINTVEIENELKKSLENKIEIVEYELSEIEVLFNQKDLNKNLEEIYETIKNSDFITAVKKYSISPSSENDGKMGKLNEKSLSKVYLNELKKLNIGEITNPIRSGESVVILKIDNIKKIGNEEIDLEKIKKEIVLRKRDEKLNLFSRSHLSSVENSILVKFK
tara:strand:- start:2326 stop:3264 length:939 start_codon:yes stop_codon:yes gene_type:complete